MSSYYPLISLVIPVYNTDKFLRICLESAIAQDYPNLEIFILNNGSTDDSFQIISEFAKVDKRINVKTIDHVPTVKMSKDNACHYASSEWIIILDSDDTVEKEYVSKLWKRHLETNADTVCSRRISMDLDGIAHDQLPTKEFDYNSILSGKMAAKLTISKWELSANGALTRKDNLNNNYIENLNCAHFTDEFDSRLLLFDSNLVAFSEASYFYTFNPNSVGKKNNWNKHKYKLTTRLGLLPFVQKEYGINSNESDDVAFQTLGLSLLACRFYSKEKNSLSPDQVEDIKKIFDKIDNIIVYNFHSLKSLRNSILKLIFNIIRVR